MCSLPCVFFRRLFSLPCILRIPTLSLWHTCITCIPDYVLSSRCHLGRSILASATVVRGGPPETYNERARGPPLSVRGRNVGPRPPHQLEGRARATRPGGAWKLVDVDGRSFLLYSASSLFSFLFPQQASTHETRRASLSHKQLAPSLALPWPSTVTRCSHQPHHSTSFHPSSP